jgi:transcriptional regulator with XRE-family HTH domain
MFREKLKELREQKSLSQREMARRLNISSTFYNDVECGRRGPLSLETILNADRNIFSEAELGLLCGESVTETTMSYISTADDGPLWAEVIRLVDCDPRPKSLSKTIARLRRKIEKENT